MNLTDARTIGLDEDDVRAIKSAFVQSGRDGVPCASALCLYVATTRVFWPVLPHEEFPVYCDACAAVAKGVLETLGHRYRDEPLPSVRRAARRVAVGGIRP